MIVSFTHHTHLLSSNSKNHKFCFLFILKILTIPHHFQNIETYKRSPTII
uniref:Uncharacterized protein n=1 Tax=Rhizophora mucronata TaxID=61149 RepID=A0A2P2P7V7_RHIMU